jgi:predicted NBD/HSP70 family sugar kinase
MYGNHCYSGLILTQWSVWIRTFRDVVLERTISVPRRPKNSEFYVGVHVGSSQCNITAWAGLLSDTPIDDAVSFAITRSPDGQGDFQADIDRIIEVIGKMEDDYGQILGIGIGAVGKVSYDRTRLVMSGNLPHWVGLNITQQFSDAFGCQVLLGNDVEIAAIYEKLCGTASEEPFRHRSFLMINWDAGIGATRVAGRLATSAYGTSVTYQPSEIGHMVIDRLSDRACVGCSTHGHLEALCGGAHLSDRFGVVDLSEMSASMWEQVANDMLVGLESALMALPSTSLLIFTGSIIQQNPWMLDWFQEHFDDERFDHPKFFMSSLQQASQASARLLLLSKEQD